MQTLLHYLHYLRYGAQRLLKRSDFSLFESVFSPLQRLCLPVIVALTCTAAHGQEPAINPQLAAQYFSEAREVCARDAGRLWGVSLCGPMLFADPATRAVVANQPDKENRLRPHGEVFIGAAPPETVIANTATEWAGVKWTMVEQFQAAIPAARDKNWFRFTLGGVPKESWLWESTRLTTHFDPALVLRKIKCPTLLMFGALDPNYPVQKSADIMARALNEAGNKDVTIKIFPGANHSLQVRQPDGKLIGAPMAETETEWAIKRINVNF